MENKEVDKLYKDFLNQYPNLDYDINKKAIDLDEIKSILYQIDNNTIINLLGTTIKEYNIEKQKEEQMFNKLKEYDFEQFMSLDKIIIILKYMYYEYNITTDDFINICTNILRENVTREFVKYLIDKDIIKLLDDDKISLSQGGINLSASLGFSLSDENKDSYVYSIKKKINS